MPEPVPTTPQFWTPTGLRGPLYTAPPDIRAILNARLVFLAEGGLPVTEINPAVIRKFQENFHFGAMRRGEGQALEFLNNDSPFDRGVVFHFGIQYYGPNLVQLSFPLPVMHPVTGEPVTWELYYNGLMAYIYCAIRSVITPAHLKEAVTTELVLKKKCMTRDISLRTREHLFGIDSPLAQPTPKARPAPAAPAGGPGPAAAGAGGPGPAAAGASEGGRRRRRKSRRKSKKTSRRR